MLAVRVTTLNRITTEINTTDDLESIIQIMANQARWLLDFEVCGLALVDGQGQSTFRLIYPFDTPLWSVQPGSWLAGQLANLRTTTIPDIQAHEQQQSLRHMWWVEPAVRSLLLIPLRIGPTFEGVLFCGSSAVDQYQSADLHIAHLFGSQISAAIHRSRLAFQLRNEHANLSTLYQTLGELASITSVADLLERLTLIGVLHTGAQRGTVIQLDPGDGTPRQIVGWPQDLRSIDPAAVIQQGLFPQVLAVQQPLLISNVSLRPDWHTTVATEAATHSLLCVPISLRGKLSGVLALTHDEIGMFDDSHRDLMVTLAQQAAVMLENVRFYEQQSRLFHQYVSTNVADQLMLNPTLATLGGQRQPVTILFADIENFTPYAESHNPEDLITVLNIYLGLAADAVLECGGTLDKFMGDAVMAIFNAPLPQPDHVARAAQAALRLQQLVAEYHALSDGAERLAFRVGIHTGEAVVGNIGTQQVRNYTTIGDVVNTAKRIQEVAGAGEILVSAEVQHSLGASLPLTAIGEVVLKGKTRPQPLYRLRAPG
ncbi:MAG: GAF domain-containing protein [Herpetosiphonaceae bacterium]|nr:GAF domain-containing protein [Herpetosiphonaceae bacterium]